MEVNLIVVGGKGAGQQVNATGPEFVIGREDDCQLRPKSELVSRRHCAILVKDGLAIVRDFGSKNGTLVNGQRVEGELELKSGDHLTVGPLEFEVRLSVSVSGKKKPKVTSVQEAAARTVENVGNDEVDLNELFTDDTTKRQPAAETRIAGDTKTTKTAVNFNVISDSDSNKPKKDKADKKAPAELPTDSSREAASDMLKQMFKQK